MDVLLFGLCVVCAACFGMIDLVCVLLVVGLGFGFAGVLFGYILWGCLRLAICDLGFCGVGCWVVLLSVWLGL